MFPNYCFRKPPPDYSTVYLPTVSGSRKRSGSRSLGSHHKKGRCDDSLPPQVVWGSNARLSCSARLRTQPVRIVGFRKPKSCRRKRKKSQAAGIEMNEECCCQTRQQAQCGHGERFDSSHSADQETCTNFFKVLYDNILESLQNTIEHVVSNHFGRTLRRIDELAAKLQQQQIDMKQLNAAVIDQINRQSETSLNQFKFIAQMLVENHKLFYEILNSQRHLSKENCPESTEEQGARKAGDIEYPLQQQPSSIPDTKEEGKLQTRPQHNLSEQQDMDTTARETCHGKVGKPANTRSSKSAILCSEDSRSVATASMPDLRKNTSSRQSQKCADPIASLPKRRYSHASTEPNQTPANAAVEGKSIVS